MDINIPSRLLDDAVNELSRLPGVGKKTALRLALHLLNEEPHTAIALGNAIIHLREDIQYCQKCHNISDTSMCRICSSPSREQNILCIVRDIRDVMAIENTSSFNGRYHVLGNILSPMDGIGPQDLNLQSLLQRLEVENIREALLALPSTVEGDTTGQYIAKQIKKFNINITTIARGIGVGDELEYADEITLGRSITNRVPFEE